jgi:hypothetical protein
MREWPWWWNRRSSWRLVTRGWNTRGEAVNLHGRATEPLPGELKDAKTLWAGKKDGPMSIPSSGLHFSNLLPVGDLLIVAEGMTDWLAGVEMFPGVAVRGATSGGFASFADLGIPLETRVVSVTDEDKAGDNYHAELCEALPGREILRARPSRLRPPARIGKFDLSDAWMAGRTAFDLLKACERSTPVNSGRRWHDFFPGGIPGCVCPDCACGQVRRAS